jgi:hypothetical protein
MSANPHIREGNSPLDALIHDALQLFGEFAPSTLDGETSQLMLFLANDVLDDLHEHPYWVELGLPPIAPYVSIHDARPVEDGIMVHGLLAKYAIQQKSSTAQFHVPAYTRKMSARLWHQLSGGGRIQMRPMDRAPGSSRITGMPEGDA